MLSWARNSAVYRLERQMMTEKQLFDAITRKARQKFEDISQQQLKAVAEFAVKFAYDLNALNDADYAQLSTQSAVRSGKSKRAIAQKLSAKGIDRETAAVALRRPTICLLPWSLLASALSAPSAAASSTTSARPRSCPHSLATVSGSR